MTVFDKFRNCITEPRCRDCEGIPGVCEVDHQSVRIPKALALDVLNELKKQEDMIPIHAIADWLAGYAVPPKIKGYSVKDGYQSLSAMWMKFLEQFKERTCNDLQPGGSQPRGYAEIVQSLCFSPNQRV